MRILKYDDVELPKRESIFSARRDKRKLTFTVEEPVCDKKVIEDIRIETSQSRVVVTVAFLECASGTAIQNVLNAIAEADGREPQ